MKYAALALVVASLAPAKARAQDAEPADEAAPIQLLPSRANATVVGPNPAYIGQMSQVEVELLRDDRQEKKPAPFFPEIQVQGAIAILSTSAPPPEVREIEGVPFLVQKRRYLVFPQEPGSVSVPAIAIALPGRDGRPLAVSTKPVTLKADVPTGTGGRLPLVARSVQIQRKIDGDLGALRVGDAFTMSVELTASDTDAVMLPAFEAPQLEGLSRYPAEGKAQTSAARGAYLAARTDTVTYVANQWGRYTLPRVAVFWLDPETGKYDEAVAPALAFRARINPSLGTGCVGGPEAVARTGGLLLLVVLFALFGLHAGRRWAAWRASRARVQRTADEKVVFAELLNAAKAARDAPTLTALYRWLGFVLVGVPTLERMRAPDADPQLTRAIDSLEGRVIGQKVGGSATDVVAPLERYRHGTKPTESKRPLPPLNQV